MYLFVCTVFERILLNVFLLTVINGEKASYCTPTFSEKRNRTLTLLLKDVEHKCTTGVTV